MLISQFCEIFVKREVRSEECCCMKKKKVLITANIDLFIFKFLLPYLKYFHDNKYEVHVASNGDTASTDIPYCDKKYNICFSRTIFNNDNLVSYKQIKKIIQKNNYDLIFCHTPFGAAITRFAARKLQKKGKVKVVYTAHGFHFYKGGSWKNWLIFYNAEKFLAKYTDVLITINQEDYDIAKRKFKTHVEYVPGIGIDNSKYDFELSKAEKDKLKASLKIPNDSFVMIYSAELNKNKNQILLINVMKNILQDFPNTYLLLPGNDTYGGYYQSIVKKENLSKNILFLNFRKDIPQLLKISDLAVASSIREGLGLNVIEALYSGLPVVATNNRGHRDFIINGENGFLVDINNPSEFENKVRLFITRKNNPLKKNNNIQKMLEKYLLKNVLQKMDNIFKKLEDDNDE